MQIKVFTTKTCPWCVKTKDYFKQHGVLFEEIMVDQNNDAAQEMIEKSGQPGVPVISINNWEHYIIGFDQEELDEVIRKYKSKK